MTTSGAVGAMPQSNNYMRGSGALPGNIHVGQQRQDSKPRGMLQSAKEISRVSA